MLADKTYSAVRNNLTVVKNIYFRTEWHTHMPYHFNGHCVQKSINSDSLWPDSR